MLGPVGVRGTAAAATVWIFKQRLTNSFSRWDLGISGWGYLAARSPKSSDPALSNAVVHLHRQGLASPGTPAMRQGLQRQVMLLAAEGSPSPFRFEPQKPYCNLPRALPGRMFKDGSIGISWNGCTDLSHPLGASLMISHWPTPPVLRGQLIQTPCCGTKVEAHW